MGRVTAEVTIENLQDRWEAKKGLRPQDQVRRITVPDALVDTGATMLSLPSRLLQQLGVAPFTKKRSRTSAGVCDAQVFEAVWLTIKDRSCTMDVMEVPDTVPVLIGQLPLEALDFVPDPASGSLIGNPAHGGEHIIEAY